MSRIFDFLKSALAPNVKPTKKFDENIEGLRGFAAIAVMLSHGLATSNALETGWKPPELIAYFGVGALSVLIFFMLSGYVIGLNAGQNALFNSALFYKKRLIRLYPIYLLSFSSLLLLGTKNSFFQTIGNLFMLQKDNKYWSVFFPVELNLSPIWSINYEVIFYLIFPIIIIKAPKIFVLIGGLLLISLVGYYTNILPLFISDYTIGYLFWITGLIIAWYVPPNNDKKVRFLSYIFLIMAWNHFSLGKVVLKGTHLFDDRDHGLSLDILFYIPLCIMIISDVSNRKLFLSRAITLYSYLLPCLMIIYLLITDRLFESTRWLMSTVFYLLALLLYSETRLSAVILKKLTFLGGISYAIYLFNWPLMIIIGKYYPYNSTMSAYIQKFIVWMILTIILSFVAERVMQPKIRAYFQKR